MQKIRVVRNKIHYVYRRPRWYKRRSGMHKEGPVGLKEVPTVLKKIRQVQIISLLFQRRYGSFKETQWSYFRLFCTFPVNHRKQISLLVVRGVFSIINILLRKSAEFIIPVCILIKYDLSEQIFVCPNRGKGTPSSVKTLKEFQSLFLPSVFFKTRDTTKFS